MASLFDPYIPLLLYLVVWVIIFVVGVLLKADRFGVIMKPYYLMLRTGAFNSWMERLANRWKNGWRVFFDIGAAMGIGMLGYGLYALSRNVIALVVRSPQASPTSLIIPLPGLTITWDVFPYIMISIAVLLIPHEVAHGIASVIDKVPLKSSGVFLAIILPGGFVEIDEEDLAKKAARTKLRVFAAGSFTNIVSAILVIILTLSFFSTPASGALITELLPGGGAQQANIPQWSVVTAVNNMTVHSVTDLQRAMSTIQPGQTVLVKLNTGQLYSVVTKADQNNASRPLLGIRSDDYHPSIFPFLPTSGNIALLRTFGWLNIILPSVGIVNMLPLFPFDGDRYFDTVLRLLGVKKTRYARITAGLISLGLLVFSLALSYVRFGTIFLR